MEDFFWCDVCRHATVTMVEAENRLKTTMTCSLNQPMPSSDIKCRRYEADIEQIRERCCHKKQSSIYSQPIVFLQKTMHTRWYWITAICITLLLLAIALCIFTIIQ
jgi:hypothetical protein